LTSFSGLLLLRDENCIQEEWKDFVYGRVSTGKANRRVWDGGLLMTTRSDSEKLTSLLLNIKMPCIAAKEHQPTPQKDVCLIRIRVTPLLTTHYRPGREICMASIGLALWFPMRAKEASCALQEDAETLVRQEWAFFSRVSSTMEMSTNIDQGSFELAGRR